MCPWEGDGHGRGSFPGTPALLGLRPSTAPGSCGSSDGVTGASTRPVLAVTSARCVSQQVVHPHKPGLTPPSFLTSNPPMTVSTQGAPGSVQRVEVSDGNQRSSSCCKPVPHLGQCCGKQRKVKCPSLDIRPRAALCPSVTVMEVTVPLLGTKVHKGPKSRAGRRPEGCLGWAEVKPETTVPGAVWER